MMQALRRGPRLDRPGAVAGRVVSDYVLGSDAARAVGRFRVEGPLGYRARSDINAPLRATRAEAEADELAILESRVSAPEYVAPVGQPTKGVSG